MKGFRSSSPTLGDQIEVLRIWWGMIENTYVKEFNKFELDKQKQISKSRLKEVPLEKVYDFIIKKHVVKDR